MKPRVLIVTPWWPTQTGGFREYSEGILAQLEDERLDTELLIATPFENTKFAAVVAAMTQGEEWALSNGHDFVFVVRGDNAVPPGTLWQLIQRDRDVILPGSGHGEGLAPVSQQTLDREREGWGVMLVKAALLESVPFRVGLCGDFASPFRLWFKRLLQLGVKAWVDYDTPVNRLESAQGPAFAFQPERKALTQGG